MFAIYLLFYKDITILYMHKKKFPPSTRWRKLLLKYLFTYCKLFLEEVLNFFVRNHLFVKYVSTSFR